MILERNATYTSGFIRVCLILEDTAHKKTSNTNTSVESAGNTFFHCFMTILCNNCRSDSNPSYLFESVFIKAVSWIRIRLEPELLPGSGFIIPDPDTARKSR